jgi:hypothetical protein
MESACTYLRHNIVATKCSFLKSWHGPDPPTDSEGSGGRWSSSTLRRSQYNRSRYSSSDRAKQEVLHPSRACNGARDKGTCRRSSSAGDSQEICTLPIQRAFDSYAVRIRAQAGRSRLRQECDDLGRHILYLFERRYIVDYERLRCYQGRPPVTLAPKNAKGRRLGLSSWQFFPSGRREGCRNLPLSFQFTEYKILVRLWGVSTQLRRNRNACPSILRLRFWLPVCGVYFHSTYCQRMQYGLISLLLLLGV